LSDRRNTERPIRWIRGVGERLLPRKRGTGHVLCPDVDQVKRMRRGLDIREVELADLSDGFEDRAQLVADAVDLLVRNFQSRELCDVEDVFPRYCHRHLPV
jgi:hypothetical protein